MHIRMKLLYDNLAVIIHNREVELKKLKLLRHEVKYADFLGQDIIPGRLLDKINNVINDNTLTMDQKITAIIPYLDTPEIVIGK